MAISKDRLYTIIMTPLLVAVFAAAADGLINGNEQDAHCNAVMAETLKAVEKTSENLEQFADGNNDISIRVSKDMKDDPDFPRFPIVGATTCSEYISIESPISPG